MAKTLWYKSKSGLSGHLIDRFQESFPVDKRLADEDIDGSIAYAGALSKAGILSRAESRNIQKGLSILKKKFSGRSDAHERSAPYPKASGRDGYEDVHTAVEAMLIKKSGKAALKVHTGRSRNEQVASDERLYLKKEIRLVHGAIRGLQESIVAAAQKYIGVVMPGYTHLQQAQPVLFSFYLMNCFFALERDKSRLQDCYKRVDVSPYGSGALAGNAYKINRHQLAGELGFTCISANALDAVTDRDFIAECLSNCAILMTHLSRFCEDFIIWSSTEFGFIRLVEGLATSSSLMPQKHNPDALELIRGKTGRVYGNLMNILTVAKGLPSGYNKDLQEDKPPMFDTLDTVKECLQIFTLAIKTIRIFPERMKQSINSYILATDLADYLVRKGLPFRSSHHIVSKLVRYSVDKERSLVSLRLEEFRKFSPLFGSDVYKVFDVRKSIESKNTPGGTATAMVKKQITTAKKLLK